MDTSKIIKGVVNSGRYTVTAPIIKEDYGLYLQIEGVELPSTYEVDFSNSENNGTSVTMIGNADGVLIPHQFIETGKDVFAFLYWVGEDYGKTVYKFRIPNKVRPDRTNEEPTPEEQSVIDQVISALNSAVEQTAQDVIDADASAQSAQGYAEQAETAKSDAQTYANNAQRSTEASGQSASASAQSASASARSEENARGYAQRAEDALEEFTTPTASATTLPEGSNATASYADGNFDFGIPKGDTGESPVTLRLSKDVVYVPMDREYRTKIAITDNIYYEYRRGDEQIDGIMDYTGTLNGTNITCTNVRACTPTQSGYMRFTIPQGVPLRTNEDTQLIVNFRFVFDYTDLDGNRKTIARGINFVGVMDGEQGIQGERGLTGATGATGATPNLTIGTVETLEPTESATASITGTPENPVLNLGIPQGDTGEVTLEEFYKAFPTDTASGAVASFSDGADDLPLKSLVVDINPIQDLHGQDAPYPAGGGKNLFGFEKWLSDNGVEYTKSKSGNFYTFQVIAGLFTRPFVFSETDTEVTLSFESFSNGTSVDARMTLLDSSNSPVRTIYADTTTVKTTGTACKVRMDWQTGGAGTVTIKAPQIELGSTATSYAPYENICPISGWTSVDVEQSGKNLFDIRRFAEVYPYHCTYDESADELTVIAQAPMFMTGVAVDIPLNATNGGYLQVEAENVSGTNFRIRIVFEDGSIDETSGTGTATGYIKLTRTLPAKRIVTVRFNWSNSGKFKIKNFCLSQSQTATPYEPYTGRSITINLGQTVYGGKLDVLSGELVVDRVFATKKWGQMSSVYSGTTHSTKSLDFDANVLKGGQNSITNITATYIEATTTQSTHYYVDSNFKAVYVVLPNDTNTDTDIQVCGTLVEPIEIQLTPNQVNSLLGVNNIWADSGDSEVVYRADTKLFIERLTAPDSEDMVADANITSGQYFMVGNSLYKATANIANGASIIVGTNCIRKSLSEALNEINA